MFHPASTKSFCFNTLVVMACEDRGRLWFELSGAARKKADHDEGYFRELAESAAPPAEDSGKKLEGVCVTRLSLRVVAVEHCFHRHRVELVHKNVSRRIVCRFLFSPSTLSCICCCNPLLQNGLSHGLADASRAIDSTGR